MAAAAAAIGFVRDRPARVVGVGRQKCVHVDGFTDFGYTFSRCYIIIIRCRLVPPFGSRYTRVIRIASDLQLLLYYYCYPSSAVYFILLFCHFNFSVCYRHHLIFYTNKNYITFSTYTLFKYIHPLEYTL